MAELNPTHVRLLRYMTYDHLPLPLQAVSKPLCDVAHALAERGATAVDPAEFTVGLRKLLEAKDCLVRAMLPEGSAVGKGADR